MTTVALPDQILTQEPLHLRDICDQELLEEMVEQKMITRRVHPELKLMVHNYSQVAVYSGTWNEATLMCRGLITDQQGAVIARPFGKFFNLSDHTPGTLPDEPFEVFDKADGSLGILFEYDGQRHISTRGSLSSTQAAHATALWRKRYDHLFTLPVGQTMLVEIIAPDNRIVLDYDGQDDLILLAAIDNRTGLDVTLPPSWPGPVVRQFKAFTDLDQVRQHFSASPGDGTAEGFVLRFASGLRVKTKYAEYIRLHKTMTELSTTTLWSSLAISTLAAAGYSATRIGSALGLDVSSDVAPIMADPQGWLASLLEDVPDELFLWIKAQIALMQDNVQALNVQVRARYVQVAALATRKEQAAALREDPALTRVAVFNLLNGSPTEHCLWAAVKPERQVFFKGPQLGLN